MNRVVFFIIEVILGYSLYFFLTNDEYVYAFIVGILGVLLILYEKKFKK